MYRTTDYQGCSGEQTKWCTIHQKLTVEWVYANCNLLVKQRTGGIRYFLLHAVYIYAVYRRRPSGTPLTTVTANLRVYIIVLRYKNQNIICLLHLLCLPLPLCFDFILTSNLTDGMTSARFAFYRSLLRLMTSPVLSLIFCPPLWEMNLSSTVHLSRNNASHLAFVSLTADFWQTSSNHYMR